MGVDQTAKAICRCGRQGVTVDAKGIWRSFLPGDKPRTDPVVRALHMFSRLNVHNIHTTNEPSESVVAGSNLRARMSANATLSTTSALHHASSYSTATQIRTRQTTIIPRPLTRTTFPERTHNALLREHCAQRKKQSYSAVNIWIYGEHKQRRAQCMYSRTC